MVLMQMVFNTAGITLSATGWAPVPGPMISIAVPAHTSPNAPRPNNLEHQPYAIYRAVNRIQLTSPT